MNGNVPTLKSSPSAKRYARCRACDHWWCLNCKPTKVCAACGSDDVDLDAMRFDRIGDLRDARL